MPKQGSSAGPRPAPAAEEMVAVVRHDAMLFPCLLSDTCTFFSPFPHPLEVDEVPNVGPSSVRREDPPEEMQGFCQSGCCDFSLRTKTCNPLAVQSHFPSPARRPPGRIGLTP